MPNKYSQFFAVLKKLDLPKEEVIADFTEGRTESLKELSDGEFGEMMRRLGKYNTPPPGNQTRRKMISLAWDMRKGKTSQEVVKWLNEWCLQQKFKKGLNALSPAELGVLCTVLETKVYKDYLEHV